MKFFSRQFPTLFLLLVLGSGTVRAQALNSPLIVDLGRNLMLLDETVLADGTALVVGWQGSVNIQDAGNRPVLFRITPGGDVTMTQLGNDTAAIAMSISTTGEVIGGAIQGKPAVWFQNNPTSGTVLDFFDVPPLLGADVSQLPSPPPPQDQLNAYVNYPTSTRLDGDLRILPDAEGQSNFCFIHDETADVAVGGDNTLFATAGPLGGAVIAIDGVAQGFQQWFGQKTNLDPGQIGVLSGVFYAHHALYLITLQDGLYLRVPFVPRSAAANWGLYE